MGGQNPLVTFVYPAPEYAFDGVAQCVLRTGRFAKRHRVAILHTPPAMEKDTALAVLITSAAFYPRAALDEDITRLARWGIPFVVLHHNDHGQPSPPSSLGIPYSSACWTETGRRRLQEMGYAPVLTRLPLLPAIYPRPRPSQRLKVGTVGHVEPKKMTRQMAARMRELGVPFCAYGPTNLCGLNKDYLFTLVADGCGVHLYPWGDFERLTILLECTHFLFCPGPSKQGTGGGATTPTQVTLFNRPVLLVDDEDTYARDGFHVFGSLADVTRASLEGAGPPVYDYGPDEYLDALTAVACREERR